METPKFTGSVIIGLVLIIVGSLFMLDNYNIVTIPYEYLSWPYFFIAVVILFLLLARNKTAGLVLLAIGLFNLWPELWPLILVLIGLHIIFGRNRRFFRQIHYTAKFGTAGESQTKPGSISDYVESYSIFGGGSKIINSDNFRGGSILAIFGGSEINLTNCQLAEGENIIDVTAIFGGTTLIVPSDWKIILDVLPIFGGFGDKRMKDPNKSYIEGKMLTIKGLVMFGGGEIKTSF